MKPFSMESTLRYRVQLEKLAQQKLFSTLKQKINIKQQVKQLESELDKLHHELDREQQQGITVENLLITERWISKRQECLNKAKIQLKSLSEKVLKNREKLIETSRNKKALEKLKKKRNTAFKHYLEKREITMLDEITVLRHNR